MNVDIMGSYRNGPQLSTRHDDDASGPSRDIRAGFAAHRKTETAVFFLKNRTEIDRPRPA